MRVFPPVYQPTVVSLLVLDTAPVLPREAEHPPPPHARALYKNQLMFFSVRFETKGYART